MRIAITPPQLCDSDIEHLGSAVTSLLDDAGWNRVHLRFPAVDAILLKRLIDLIPDSLWPRLTLHDNYDLALERGLGIQLNNRNVTPDHASMKKAAAISISCHSVDEVISLASPLVDYVTLSPVFDSISKPGYEAAVFETECLASLGIGKTGLIALGGVNIDKVETLARLGFDGYAVLGALPWNQPVSEIIKVAKQFKDI